MLSWRHGPSDQGRGVMSERRNMDQDREAMFAEIRATRGYLLPVHELLGNLDPELLRQYRDLSANLLFSPEPRALDLKTRYLVLVGITTAIKGDREGIEWSSRGAREHGATEREILEAIALAALPAGIPALEGAAKALGEERQGRALIDNP